MQNKETTLAIIAIVAALGLLAVVVVESISMPQHQVGAKSTVGQCASFFKNSSAQFCHNFR